MSLVYSEVATEMNGDHMPEYESKPLPDVVERFMRYVQIDSQSDPEHDLLSDRRLPALLDQLLIHRVEFQHAHIDTRQHMRITRLVHADLLQHLYHYHLKSPLM